MSNPANNGTVIGRLAADPKFIPHAKSNGKTGTALLTVYSQNNYVTKSSGERESVRVDLEDFIADASNVGPYAFLKQGMQVAINYAVANSDYTDKDGTKRYGMKLVVERGGIQILESKDAVANRESRGKAQTFGQAAQAPVQQEQAAPQPGIGAEQAPQAQGQPAPAQAQAFNTEDVPF